MIYVLTIIFMVPGQVPETTQIGWFDVEDYCVYAGAGVARALAEDAPAAAVTWGCIGESVGEPA